MIRKLLIGVLVSLVSTAALAAYNAIPADHL